MIMTGKKADELKEKLAGLEKGEAITFPSPMVGLDKKAEAQFFLTDKTDKWYEFVVYFLGIRIAKVTAEVTEKGLELEEI